MFYSISQKYNIISGFKRLSLIYKAIKSIESLEYSLYSKDPVVVKLSIDLLFWFNPENLIHKIIKFIKFNQDIKILDYLKGKIIQLDVDSIYLLNNNIVELKDTLKIWTLDILGNYPDEELFYRTLLEYTEHTNPFIRNSAIKSLANFDRFVSEDIFLKALKDSNWIVYNQALKIIKAKNISLEN